MTKGEVLEMAIEMGFDVEETEEGIVVDDGAHYVWFYVDEYGDDIVEVSDIICKDVHKQLEKLIDDVESSIK